MKTDDDSLRDDYDFSEGIRGKYYEQAKGEHEVTIKHPDGSVTVEVFPSAIELDADVREFFPDSEAVNKALRGLIELIPTTHKDEQVGAD